MTHRLHREEPDRRDAAGLSRVESDAASLASVGTRPSPTFSVVIPVFNEARNIGSLLAEIDTALARAAPYEVIVVDDASTDGTLESVRALQPAWEGRLRLLRHRRNLGQSSGLRTGVLAARAPWIVTLDGDGQNDPVDIPRLLDVTYAPNGDVRLVCGHRIRRNDPFSKRIASRVANGFRSLVLRDATPDSGCGLKVFPRQVFLALPFFDHVHRFLPALMQQEGRGVVSVEVRHRPRAHGRSNYGVCDRLWSGIIDTLGVLWLRRRARETTYDEIGGLERDRHR